MWSLFQTLFYDPLQNLFFFLLQQTEGKLALSVVLIVFFVRIILFPLYLKFLKTQEKLKSVKKDLKKIQKRYKHDRQKMSQEIMNTYKKKGIQLRYIFLFFFIQIPLYILLFFVIKDWNVFTSIEVVTHFFSFDLEGERNYILLFVVGITQFFVLYLTQKRTNEDKDNIRIQQGMLYGLPIIVSLIALFIGNIIVWYMIVMNFFSILQEGGILLRQTKSPK